MRGRLLLLSLSLVPACVSRKQKDDDGDPQRKLGDGCRALYDKYMSCYASYYDTEGYEYDTAYEYDTGYTQDEYCDYMVEYLTQNYSAACARAQDDLFACLAALDCDDFTTGDWNRLCPDEVARGRQACPEVFPACECGEFGSSDGSCGLDCRSCDDGNTYSLECSPPANIGDPSMCTCTVNGMVTQSFDAANACLDLDTLGQEQCGIP